MNRYKALKLAAKAHAGQRDKAGDDLILHPIAVAEAIERTGVTPSDLTELAVIGALLHDVPESTPLKLVWDGWKGARAELVDTLDLVTRRSGETYDEYIGRLCHPILLVPPFIARTARIVKLADHWHNLQPERLGRLPAGERRSLERRYLKSRERIWKALGERWWPIEEHGISQGQG